MATRCRASAWGVPWHQRWWAGGQPDQHASPGIARGYRLGRCGPRQPSTHASHGNHGHSGPVFWVQHRPLVETPSLLHGPCVCVCVWGAFGPAAGSGWRSLGLVFDGGLPLHFSGGGCLSSIRLKASGAARRRCEEAPRVAQLSTAVLQQRADALGSLCNVGIVLLRSQAPAPGQLASAATPGSYVEPLAYQELLALDGHLLEAAPPAGQGGRRGTQPTGLRSRRLLGGAGAGAAQRGDAWGTNQVVALP
jgi:hypothetical protein